MHKKIISVSLSLIMASTVFNASVFADMVNSYDMSAKSISESQDTTSEEFTIVDNVLIAYNSNQEIVEIPEGVTRINDGVFKENKTILKVVIPSTVKDIGESAFEGCQNLYIVEFEGDYINTIGKSAFAYCSKLTNIAIPNGLKVVDEKTFKNCVRLESIDLPASVETINSYAFEYCAFKSFTNTQNIKYLAPYAFSGCSRMTTFEMPKDMKIINDHVFYGCTNLYNTTLPDNVEEVGDYAFYGTGVGTYIEKLPSTLKSIGDYAFYYGDFASVNLPDGFNHLGEGAFMHCARLSEVTFSNELEEIGANAFSDCRSLKEVYIPNTIKSIGSGAFSGCVNLKNITLPDKLTNIPDYLLYGCEYLQKIDIPESVKSIGDYAFSKCDQIQQINLPENLDSIGKCAFEEMPISEITLPKNISKISDGALMDCENLQTLNCENENIELGISALRACSSLKNINIKNIISIGDGAFAGCVSIEALPSLKNVTNIGEDAFNGCEKLKNVDLPSDLKIISVGTFKDCYSLENIDIPNSVEEIGRRAFKNCDSLKEVIIPDCVKKIGISAFESCDLIESATILGAVEYIDAYVLSSCKNLSKVTLSEGVKKIKPFAFERNPSLKEFTIPRSVTLIDTSGLDLNSIELFRVYSDSYGERYAKAKNKEYKYIDKTYLDEIQIDPIAPQIYTGKSIIPDIYVDGNKLQDGVDYNVTNIKNNVEVGTATMYISGINNYAGEKVITFEIIKKSPEAPKLTFTSTTSTVKLLWDKVESVDGYKVYKYSPTKGTYVLLKTTTDNNYTNTNLKSASSYKYRVRSFRIVNGKYEYSKYAYITASTNPLKPTLSKQSTTTSTITLSWNKVSRATGYFIYRYNSKTGEYEAIDTVEKNSTDTITYKDTGRLSATTYSYKIRAYYEANGQIYFSNYSNIVSDTTKPLTPTAKVTSTSKNKATITWNKVNRASGYEVKMATSRYGTYSTIYTGSSLSYTKTGLSSGRTRYFKVRAYKVVDGKKVYGNYSSVVSVKIK